MTQKPQNKSKREVPILELSAAVLHDIFKTIGIRPAESGGPLGGSEQGGDVTIFHFDEGSTTSGATYSPDHRSLNQLFSTDWNPRGIRLRGFVHSHPGRMRHLSGGDRIYAEQILGYIPELELLWLPIVNTVPETGEFRLTPWAVTLTETGVKVISAKVKVMATSAATEGKEAFYRESQIATGQELDEIVISLPQEVYGALSIKEVAQALPTSRKDRMQSPLVHDGSEAFTRVQKAYDLPLMHESRIVSIGSGGAASFLEEAARAAVGQFVLIDPDTVSETNLATQQVYRRDIGRPKVDCIAERILDINPRATVIRKQVYLDDLNDLDMAMLCQEPIDGKVALRTVLCGLTDNFFAQARVNRLALKLGMPSLCAQVYHEGRGAEITYTYPGVTPACHRCILSSRYTYYLKEKRENDVTSHGTPIFATTRLNAIKGFILLALLHHGSNHPRWGSLLQRIGNRNLIQVRMDPDLSKSIGLEVFDKVFSPADRDRLFFDETLWLPQDPECPETGYEPCPDCGGGGDLRMAAGKITDTRLEPTDPDRTLIEKKLIKEVKTECSHTFKGTWR